MSDGELDNWLAGLSEQETRALEGKLKCLQYEYSFPRLMNSVLEDVFYIVQTANWHLKRDSRSRQWLEHIALHMYQFRSALQEAMELAEAVEKRTGIWGRELAEE